MVSITSEKKWAGPKMGRILKYLIYLGVLGFVGLVAYAYIGPYLGADFSAPQTEQREPIILNVD